MTPKEHLSVAESLDLISRVIQGTRENLKRQSYTFLLWGWLITLASFSFYVLRTFTTVSGYFVVFPIAAVVGVFFTVWKHRSQAAQTESFSEHFLTRLWFVLGISFFLAVFINISQGNQPFTYTLLIAGIGTLVTGMVLRFVPLMIGGTFLLAVSVLTIFLPEGYRSLVHGIGFLLGYIVPGYCLKFSKSNG